MAIYMTKGELADIAGYTYRRLYDIDRDCPDNRKLFVPEVKGKDENGNPIYGSKYSLSEFVQNWVEYNVMHETDHIKDLDQVKAKHEIIKTEKTQLEVDKMRGKLVDVQDVKRLWNNVANTVMQNLLHLSSKLGPMLCMMENPEEIAMIIDDEVRKILNNIADTPLPDYANDSTDGEDVEEE